MQRRLTKLQTEHLVSRIETVISQLSSKEIAKLGKQPNTPTYTDSEKLAMIRSGKAKLREDEDNETKYHWRVSDHFVFPLSAAMKKAKMAHERHDAAVQAIRARYKAESERLRDQAILGDSVEAMEMLKALELRNAS